MNDVYLFQFIGYYGTFLLTIMMYPQFYITVKYN